MKKSFCLFSMMLFVVFSAAAFCSEADAPNIDDIFAGMSLDEKIGQLFMPGIEGQVINEELEQLVSKYHLGGVIYFGGRNVVNRAQTAKLSTALQEASIADNGIPLLICIDQEGGVGSHVNILTGGLDTVGNMALGASPYIEDTYNSYRIMAQDLAAYGINMDLAPVVDIMLNKDNTMNHIRSFGSDAGKVSERAAAAVRGLQDHGILANAKHFPGKGETAVDSHHDAPVNKVAKDIILAPFRAAVDAGLDSVMIGHEIYESMDPDNVSTVSHKIITGVLKEELGFKGLVITDSITMGGVTHSYPSDVASMMSIKAGADMVLFAGTNPEEYAKAIEITRRAVESGELTMERIDDAVLSILRIKMKYNLYTSPWVMPTDEYKVQRKKNKKDSLRIASHTMTILKNEGGILPLNPEKADRILVVSPGPFFTIPMMDAPFPVGKTLGGKIKAVAPGVHVVEYDSITFDHDSKRAFEVAQDADVIVVGTILAYFSDTYSQFVKDLKALGKPVVVVGLSVPNDLERFPEVDAYLATYNPRSVSLSVAARALFGQVKPIGVLPVEVDY